MIIIIITQQLESGEFLQPDFQTYFLVSLSF